MKYLIIEYYELNDQYECEAYRNPLKVVDDFTPYCVNGYEIYEIKDNGNLLRIWQA